MALTSSQHACGACDTSGKAAAAALAPPTSQDTPRGLGWAVRLGIKAGFPYAVARGHLWRDPWGVVPYATRQTWVEAGGKDRKSVV